MRRATSPSRALRSLFARSPALVAVQLPEIQRYLTIKSM